MAKNQVVILGGKGMLGSDLALACKKHGFTPKVLDLPEYDITNTEQLRQALKNADIVINSAAYTNVEKAESKPEYTFKINAQAVGDLGKIAKDIGAWVLHISSDFVFDGKSDRPYVETDIPNPINVYGKSKLASERLLVESGCSNCIIRAEWTYSLNGNNFITKLVSLAKQGKQLKIVDDQVGSPTATIEVANAICELLEKKPQSLFHFASDGYVSRFEMAKFVFDKLGLAVNISSCKTSDYPCDADRPLNSRFDCSKIKKLLKEPIKPWQEPLEHCLRKL
ncbi:MAG: dTDP-4-dehydrorhamnose reductase [Planctomycetota bacterium]|jgi:dTDP-4-dehydrorhamnose reductase